MRKHTGSLKALVRYPAAVAPNVEGNTRFFIRTSKLDEA